MATTTAISIDIAVNSEVHCVDGRSGKSAAIIVNPVNKTVSSVVVEYEGNDYIVPIKYIAITTPDLIVLNCTRDELRKMSPFSTEIFFDYSIPDYYFDGEYYVEPYVEQKEIKLAKKTDSVPPGEVAVNRGNEVFATDGPVGTVDEFAVDRSNGNITHAILREGNLWQKHEVSIPIGNVTDVYDNEVHLSLSKKDIESLPSIKVERWWE